MTGRSVERRQRMAAATTNDIPESGLDPFSEGFLRDPYPAH
jgi:hypothetical protein